MISKYFLRILQGWIIQKQNVTFLVSLRLTSYYGLRNGTGKRMITPDGPGQITETTGWDRGPKLVTVEVLLDDEVKKDVLELAKRDYKTYNLVELEPEFVTKKPAQEKTPEKPLIVHPRKSLHNRTA